MLTGEAKPQRRPRAPTSSDTGHVARRQAGQRRRRACAPTTGFFFVPATPLDRRRRPTGAGDAFAGGFFGYLDTMRTTRSTRPAAPRRGLRSVVASYAIEDFGSERLQRLTIDEIEGTLRGLQAYDTLRRTADSGNSRLTPRRNGGASAVSGVALESARNVRGTRREPGQVATARSTSLSGSTPSSSGQCHTSS